MNNVYTKKQKIIFLDIDGVLNGYSFFNLLGWKIACIFHFEKWYKKHTRRPFGVHKEKVRRLSKIVNATDAKIVMSSCWRNIFWKTPYENKSEEQKLLVDLFQKYKIEVIDITPKSSTGQRDREILSWLGKNESKIDSFVILDDEKADLECFAGDRLIQTTSVYKGYFIKGLYTGLKNKHIKPAIDILNNKSIYCI